MLIKMTLVKGDLDVYVEHTTIREVSRHPGNLLSTQVATNIFTQSGPLAYEVKESASLIADAVNLAHQGQVPSALITH